MFPRGKANNKSKSRRKFQNDGKGKHKLFKNKKYKSNERQDKSRKRNFASNTNSSQETKRQKLEVQKQPEKLDYTSSEPEEENYLDLLLSSINSDYSKKRDRAIETTDESESDSDLKVINTIPLAENDSQNENLDDKDNGPQEEEKEVDLETEKEDEDLTGNINDPFAKHLFYDLSESLLTSVQSTPMSVTKSEERWPLLGTLRIEIPICEETTSTLQPILGEVARPFASAGSVPVRISNLNDPLHIKPQIFDNIAQANKCGKDVCEKSFLTPLQSEIFSVINNYQDFYFTQRTLDNCEEIRFLYTLHVVNHIMKTRTKVLHHNAKLNRKDEVPEEFRDQGLVRPKVLIVVPFRDSAYRIITMLIDIIIKEDKGNVENKNRFIEEFTGHELNMPKRNPKPEDYQVLFSGNCGDDFKIGLTITKKSIKLFANFYAADVIIASPLGLRTIIGAEGETERDFDFLASIEILIFDQMEIFMMQNWAHILHFMNYMHLQPKQSHGTDFFRVRTWSLNGWGKYYRQTLMFSSFALPEFNAMFSRKCFNYAGKVKTDNLIENGSVCKVFVNVPHVFQKFNSDDISNLSEDRLNFFTSKILPRHRDSSMKQTLIFVSNYFDYVRLRNYFKRNDVDFVQACEYSKENKVARARDMFFHGDAQFLLYTERFHFFNRIKVKGIRHLVFYQPPTFPNLYTEMCNLMQETNMNKKVGHQFNMTVTVLYSKFDIIQLASIVGTERAATMSQSEKSVHMLRTGN